MIFKLGLFLALGWGSLAAQGDGERKVGFIRLIHAVSVGEGKLTLSLNGADVYPTGYNLGDATGGIGVDTGRCEVVVSRDGVETGKTTVDIAAGETTTVIPFAEKVPATDDKPMHWEIRILRLKQTKPEKGRNAIFVSVSAQPEIRVEMRDPDGEWHARMIERFDTETLSIRYPEGYVPLRVGERPLQPIPVMDEGTYVVVLFDNPDEELTSVSFRDYMFVTSE